MSYPTRARYGLRLLVRLAMQGDDRHLSMAEIAHEEGVSVKYFEQIVSLLKPMGVLQSIRGARGGYSLLCDASEITMDRVFSSLGVLAPPVPCISDASACKRVGNCPTRPFWAEFDAHRRAFLRGITLADIVANAPQQGEAVESLWQVELPSSCECAK